MLAGSSLWQVEREPQKAAKPETTESLEANSAQQTFGEAHENIAALLDIDLAQILPSRSEWQVIRPDMAQMLSHLMTLNNDEVLRILTFRKAESLDVNSPLIDQLSAEMNTDMSDHWQPDQTFFTLIRDKQVLNAMVGEYAGQSAAAEHITATAKAQRDVLNACFDGTCKPAGPNWMPRYIAFPTGSYREEVEQEEPKKAA